MSRSNNPNARNADERYDAYVKAHFALIEVLDELSDPMLKHLMYLSEGMRDIAQFSLESPSVEDLPFDVPDASRVSDGCICGSKDGFHTEACTEANA
jgi:hypothetical protein